MFLFSCFAVIFIVCVVIFVVVCIVICVIVYNVVYSVDVFYKIIGIFALQQYRV